MAGNIDLVDSNAGIGSPSTAVISVALVGDRDFGKGAIVN
jgi:hypothetical protein